ncbi:MAG: ISKra4 family transposase [Anaerolineales bacterium]|nr:ISKra4 family transposase [Anaerolineales bacterium]
MAREKIKQEKTFDPVWFEQTLRAAAQKDTAAVLEAFLNHELPQLLPPAKRRKGEQFHSWRRRHIVTLSGPISLRRGYYVSPQGGRCPLDEQLGLHDEYTPAVAQLMCWAGAMDPSFEQGSQTLQRFAGLNIPNRQIQRVVKHYASHAAAWQKKRPSPPRQVPVPILNIQADMTGIPMRPEELKDIKGKQPDGSSKTRQIKIGCVFTQSLDAKGHPQRDPLSSSYITTFGEVADLSAMLYSEALKAGYATARETVFLGDGAEWIWHMVQDRFRGAVEIVDFYHACEHLYALCQSLESDPNQASALFRAWRSRLKRNGLPRILDEAAQRAAQLSRTCRKEVAKQLPYFRKNAGRMTYRTFRRKGYFIGSGAIEGACRHIVSQRTKLSGMRWIRTGAANVLTFRCLIKSNLFDDYCRAWLRAG